MAQKLLPSTGKLVKINKQFITAEKLLGDKNKFKIQLAKKKKSLDEKKEFEERERKIENDKPTTEEKTTLSKIKAPSFGFLDVIKNFIFNTLLGYFVVRFLPHLPKLKGVLVTTLKVSDFIIQTAGNILNALATFIDAGYKAVDFARGQMKLIGGDTGLKTMDRVLSMSNTMLNSMLIAGMLFSDLVESDARGSAATQTVEAVKNKVVEQQAANAVAQRSAGSIVSRVLAAPAAIIGLVGLASSALGEAAFQLRKFSQKVEKDAYIGLANAQKDPNPFTRFLKVGFYQAFAIPGLRLYNFVSTGIGTLLDIVGSPFRYATELINYGVMKIMGDEEGLKKQRENLGKLDARIREQIRQIVNTLSFGNLAKDQGSFGSLFGTEAVKAMGYASGGEVTRGGELLGSVTRGFERTKATRQIKVATSPLQPGSDVGGMTPYGDGRQGVTKLEAFYPNPSNPGSMNAFEYLKKSFDIVNATPFFSPLLGMAIKIIFGDKPSETDYKAVGTSLNSYLGTILDKTNVPGEKRSLADEIGNFDVSKWIKNYVSDSIFSSATSILSELVEQFKLKRTEGTGQSASPSAQKGDEPSNNPLSGYGGQAQFVIGDSIAHGFAGRGGNGSKSSDTMVGRSPEEVLVILKSKGDDLRNALIDLSTGIANRVTEWNIVEAQLTYLKSIGARVRVLGVGNNFSKANGNINEKLSQMAKKYGFYFYGGYVGASDGVHGTPQDYAGLVKRRESDIASFSTGPSSGVESGKISDRPWNTGIPLVTLKTKSGKSYRVAKGLSSDFAGFIADLEATGYKIKSIGGWRKAGTGGGTGPADPDYDRDRYSHPYGGSVDINPDQNPYRSDGKLITDFPPNISQIAEKWGLGWGGNFRSIKDTMHFSAMKREGGRGFDTTPGGPLWRGSRFHGGYIPKEGIYETHPGEYVVDADSVKLFGINFFDIINKTELMTQRRESSKHLIDILSQYTEDGYPEMEDDYTYYIPQKQTKIIPSLPIVYGFSTFGGGVSEEDPSKDYLYT